MITSLTLYKILLDLEGEYSLSGSYIHSLKHASLGYYILRLSTLKGRLELIIDVKNKVLLPLTIEERGTRKEDKITNIFKRFKNAKVEKVDQIGLERILYIEAVAKDKQRYRIYFEMIGRGNIIITDSEDIVISLLHKLKSKDRILKENYKYTLPVNIVSDLSKITPEYITGERRDLFRKLPFDPITIRELIYKLDIGEKISVDEAKILKNEIATLLNEVVSSREYSIVKDSKKIYILPYKPCESKDVEILFSSNDLFELSEFFLRNYYVNIIKKERDRDIEKLKHDKEKIIEEINRLNEKYTIYVNVIPRLYEKIGEIDKIFMRVRMGNIEGVEIDRKRKVIYLTIDNVRIPLNYEANPYKAISNLYDEVKKMKQGIQKLEKKLTEIDKKIQERARSHITLFTSRKKYYPKAWYERYVWSLSRNGHLIVGGRDAKTNEVIVKKYLETDDLLFHADIHGSPFVILKKGRYADNEDIYDAAVITAAYSKAWKLGISALNVYFVYKDQVSKKAPSGEYIRTGGFMIYGKKNFIKNIPVKLYLGVIKLDEKPKILVGSYETVERNSQYREIFEISPGQMNKIEIAKKIVSAYTDKQILPDEYRDAYINDLVNRIPGDGDIKIILKTHE
jgi:predicted ribosome quality control (RQC) complex YloA/Tae2 family protein